MESLALNQKSFDIQGSSEIEIFKRCIRWSADKFSSCRIKRHYPLGMFRTSRSLKVARSRFSRLIPPTFERKLRRHKQRFGKIDTTVVLDKEETLL